MKGLHLKNGRFQNRKKLIRICITEFYFVKLIRNEGVVEFASASDVDNVIRKLDGQELNGRAIKINDMSSGGTRSRYILYRGLTQTRCGAHHGSRKSKISRKGPQN